MPQLLSRDEEIVGAEVSLCRSFSSGQPEVRRGKAEQPLWLSETEAELLLVMCFTANTDGGEVEQTLFSKLGGLARSFSR